MKSLNRFTFSALLLLAAALSAHPSQADIAITAREVGSDVRFNYAGSITLTGFDAPTSAPSVRGLVYPVNAIVEFGPETSVSNVAHTYTSVVVGLSPDNIGTGMANVVTSQWGDYFSVSRTAIKVPLGYTSGSPISGTMIFSGKTLAGMGVSTSGSPYVWTLSNGQKVTLTILAKQVGPDNAKKIKALQKKAKTLKKKIAKAKKNQQSALLKKLKKQLKRVNAQIRKLRKK